VDNHASAAAYTSLDLGRIHMAVIFSSTATAAYVQGLSLYLYAFLIRDSSVLMQRSTDDMDGDDIMRKVMHDAYRDAPYIICFLRASLSTDRSTILGEALTTIFRLSSLKTKKNTDASFYDHPLSSTDR